MAGRQFVGAGEDLVAVFFVAALAEGALVAVGAGLLAGLFYDVCVVVEHVVVLD
jgi:hypothetical protein